MRWTQWPTSRSSSGSSRERRPLLIGCPRLAAVVRAERARRRDRDEHPLRVVGVDEDRVQAEPAGARLPLLAVSWCSRSPDSSCHVWPASVDWKSAASSTPANTVSGSSATARGARRARTPTGAACRRTTGACRERRRTRTRCRPSPSSCRRRPSAGSTWPCQPVDCDAYSRSGSTGDAVQVVHLPAREQRALDVPVVARPVRRQDERALPRPHEEPHSAHGSLPLSSVRSIQARATLLAPGEVSERSKERDWKSRTG